MTTLVLAEHDHTSLRPATASAVRAAHALGAPVTVLVAGHQCTAAAEAAAALEGVTAVWVADAPAYTHPLAESLAALIVTLAPTGAVVGAATTFGRDVLPRVAGTLARLMVSDIVAVTDARTFRRPIYAGNALATVQAPDDAPLVLSVRASAFPAVGTGTETAPITAVSPGPAPAGTRFVTAQGTDSARPELTSARTVVAGGRGVGSAAGFGLLGALADRLHGALGATRAAVDAELVPNDLQVGQTGKIVAPDLYIAVGLSGAIQHVAGMKDSRVIVAINTDPEAPIMRLADYALVADLFTAVPALTEALERRADSRG